MLQCHSVNVPQPVLTKVLQRVLIKVPQLVLKKVPQPAPIKQQQLGNLPLAILALLLFVLGGCGYQLQKPLTIANHLQPVYVEGELQLRTDLRRALKRHAIAVTNQANTAKSRILLSDVETQTRDYSLSRDGRNAELLYISTVTVEWQRSRLPGNHQPTTNNDAKTTSYNANTQSRTELLPATPLIAESIQIQNPDQLNAQQQEQLQVSKELRSQLIEKILRLLRYSQNTQ